MTSTARHGHTVLPFLGCYLFKCLFSLLYEMMTTSTPLSNTSFYHWPNKFTTVTLPLCANVPLIALQRNTLG
uniref:Uncharacterized protein n=1 Tax=Pararge aegeria TaxID=116150 RepID=S4P839_9NEOP